MDLASASTSEVPTPDGRLPDCPVGAHPRHSTVAAAGPQPSLRETPRSGLLADSRRLPGPHQLWADSPTLPLHVTWVCRRELRSPPRPGLGPPGPGRHPHLSTCSPRVPGVSTELSGSPSSVRRQAPGSRLPTAGPRHVTGDADTPNWKTVPSQSPAPPLPPRSSTE